MNIEEIKAYKCNECNKVCLDKDLAEKCCIPYHCEKCGVETDPYYLLCSSCREEKRYNKAERILYKDYKIDMFYDKITDQYFYEFEDLMDYYEEEPDLIFQGYAYACEEIPFRINIDHSLESALEDMYEDFDDIVDEKKLRDFVDSWNSKQTGKSYYPDFSKVVIF